MKKSSKTGTTEVKVSLERKFRVLSVHDEETNGIQSIHLQGGKDS